MANKRILIAIDSLHDGGAEMFAIRLANFLAVEHEVFFYEFDAIASQQKLLKSKLNPTILYYSPSDNYFVKILYFLNKITKYKAYRLFGKISNWYRFIKTKNYIIKNDIEVINSHAIFQNLIFSKIKFDIPAVKFILSLHGHFEYLEKEDPVYNSFLIRKIVDSCDHLIYTTNEQLKTFLKSGFAKDRTSKVFYGFDAPTASVKLNKSESGENGLFNLLILSRAVAEKGWIQAIKATEILTNKGYNVSLTLVGDGPLLEDLRKLNLNKNIQLLGFAEDVLPLIYQSDLCLLPTYFYGESLPNTIIEYLFCEKPVIASNIGAIADMLEYNGSLAGDLIDVEKGVPVNPQKLALIIEKYIINKDYYIKKVEIAAYAFEKFEMQYCAKLYLDLFDL